MKISQRDLAALAARKLTKTALAAKHGVSVSFISRITPKLPPGKVLAQRRRTRELAETRRAYRRKLARQVAAGRLNIHTAADHANCSVRTIYRYMPCKSTT